MAMNGTRWMMLVKSFGRPLAEYAASAAFQGYNVSSVSKTPLLQHSWLSHTLR
jgi:hypothetical protein